MSQSRQLAAVMFTDIVGYTALMGSNEQKAFDYLRLNREIHKPVISQYGGQWIKELGDGVMASFPSVSNAVYAALKIQEACKKNGAFQLRIGIHLGEVVFEAGDVFGDTVNIAARIQTAAPPGGIFVSESVYRDISNKNDITSVFVKTEHLKNVKEPVSVYQIITGADQSQSSGKVNNSRSAIAAEYNYDIQISYRDNDNRYDGWVTEFVEKLRQELGATLKDRLTIHFNRQQDEQMLNGHSLRSLIFIPIISQTYCDPQSPIWVHEFNEFQQQSRTDEIGPTIRLVSGQVSSRVLPVRIHEIDRDDIRLLENALSGDLRSIDFIYREEGVNRPLRPVDDDKSVSVNRPMYRNQINKLANAIKDIILGIKNKNLQPVPSAESDEKISSRSILPNIVQAPVSSAIRVQVIDRQRPNIFLAWTSGDLKESREEMAIILQKAGFNVLPSTDCPADDESFKKKTAEEMDKCICSLHMISGEFGRRFESEDEVSFPQYQFMQAKQKVDAHHADFNVFVWLPPQHSSTIKPAQQQFIKYIRNNITRNMMFSNSQGPMQLVDDMRIVIMKQDAAVYDSKDTDIFFIFNQQDEIEAKGIIEEISLEYPIETMNISPDGEEAYREISSQQIPKSKLAVVYFRYAADWALPFIKQIWKQVGGASSKTPMLLIGEDDPRTNLARNFRAPKVTSSIIPKQSIPTEVKKVYSTLS